jgi:hypothetical protein
MSRVGSDSAQKILPLNKHVGVTIAGSVFIEPGSRHPKSIETHIAEFAETLKPSNTVKHTAEALHSHIEGIMKPQAQLAQAADTLAKRVAELGGKPLKGKPQIQGNRVSLPYTDRNNNPQVAHAEIAPVVLIVAGYDTVDGQAEQHVYEVNVPGKVAHLRQHGTDEQYGANWSGQRDVVNRIILGFDERIERLPFFQAHAPAYDGDKLREEFKGLQYSINWGAMPLQDGVDFATLIIETTAAVQRFSDGLLMQPGDVPGVGGPVDIAVILPDDGFKWHKNKQLELH